MKTAGAHELAYANTALLALMDTLVTKGALTNSDLGEVVDDAIESMRPSRHINSIGGAISYIESAIVPKIREGGGG